MPRLFILLSLILLQGSCEKQDGPLPSCVSKRIASLKAASPRNPPSEIWEYSYHGKNVFFLTSACCDIPSEVWDEECQVLCSPDGGLTGNGDGRCPGFMKEAKDGKRIWKDDR